MPIGASKGFTVWTKANANFQGHLLLFLLENEFASSYEIFTECNKSDPKSTSSRPYGIWGLRPNKHQIWNFLKHKCIWIVESDKKLMTDIKRISKGKSVFWELAPNWPLKYNEYNKTMMDRADMLRKTGTAKWK